MVADRASRNRKTSEFIMRQRGEPTNELRSMQRMPKTSSNKLRHRCLFSVLDPMLHMFQIRCFLRLICFWTNHTIRLLRWWIDSTSANKVFVTLGNRLHHPFAKRTNWNFVTVESYVTEEYGIIGCEWSIRSSWQQSPEFNSLSQFNYDSTIAASLMRNKTTVIEMIVLFQTFLLILLVKVFCPTLSFLWIWLSSIKIVREHSIFQAWARSNCRNYSG